MLKIIENGTLGAPKSGPFLSRKNGGPRGRFSMIFGIVAMPPQGFPRVAQGRPRLPPWAQIGSPWEPFGLTLAALWLPLASPWPPFGTHLAHLDIPLALAWRFSASLGVLFVSFGDRLASLSGKSRTIRGTNAVSQPARVGEG